MSQNAAIYLSSFIEYIASEVLQSAVRNTLEDDKNKIDHIISSRQVMCAVVGDDELGQLLENVYYRDAGVIPHLHRKLLARHHRESKFNKLLIKKLNLAKVPIIDPRTGMHVYSEENNVFITHSPLFDALCKQDRSERLSIARSALTPVEKK